MIVLSLLGLAAAIWVWNNVNPVLGLIVGFLGVGGLGWNMLFGAVGLATRPGFGEFVTAFQKHTGQNISGDDTYQNLLVKRMYRTWRQDRLQDESADAWFTRQTDKND